MFLTLLYVIVVFSLLVFFLSCRRLVNTYSMSKNIPVKAKLPVTKRMYRVLKRRKKTNNLIQMRIVNSDIQNVNELNTQLELCQAFDNTPMTVALVSKIFDVLLNDRAACSIEKLTSLEFINGNIQIDHIDSLEKLFEMHGADNYLFSIRIFMLCNGIKDCSEKSGLLHKINQRIDLPNTLEQSTQQTA